MKLLVCRINSDPQNIYNLLIICLNITSLMAISITCVFPILFPILLWNKQVLFYNFVNSWFFFYPNLPFSENIYWWTSIINSSKFNPPRENGDQLLEHREENKSLYPDYALVIQGLLTLSYWNRNHNHSV